MKIKIAVLVPQHPCARRAALTLMLGWWMAAADAGAATTNYFTFFTASLPANTGPGSAGSGNMAINCSTMKAGDVVVFDATVASQSPAANGQWGAIEFGATGGFEGLTAGEFGVLASTTTDAEHCDTFIKGSDSYFYSTLNLNASVVRVRVAFTLTAAGSTTNMNYLAQVDPGMTGNFYTQTGTVTFADGNVIALNFATSVSGQTFASYYLPPTAYFNFGTTAVAANSGPANPAGGAVSLNCAAMSAGSVVVFDGEVASQSPTANGQWGAVEFGGAGFEGLTSAKLGVLASTTTDGEHSDAFVNGADTYFYNTLHANSSVVRVRVELTLTAAGSTTNMNYVARVDPGLTGNYYTLTGTATFTNPIPLTFGTYLTGQNFTNNYRPTTLMLTNSGSPSAYGGSLTFMAAVQTNGVKAGNAAGTVVFYDGTSVLGTSQASGGTATFTTSNLTSGSHSITAAYAGSSNLPGAVLYGVSASTAVAQTVNPLAVQLSGSKTYNGSTAINAANLVINNKIGSDSVTLSGSATLASANAGTQPITSVGSLTLGGAAAGNYTLTGYAGSATVNQAGLTPVVTLNNFTYNGATGPATIATRGTTGTIYGSDSPALTGGTVAPFGSPNVGNYTAIMVTGLGLAGAGAANYQLSNSSTTAGASITPASLSVTANHATKECGQSLAFAGTEFTTSGLIPPDRVTNATLTSIGAAAGAGTGMYPILPGAATGPGLGNYIINYYNGTLTVRDTTPPVIIWSLTNLVVVVSSNCSALMPDVTGASNLLAEDACSGSLLTITQSPTNGAALSLGANWVVIAVTDQSGNTAWVTNKVVVADTNPPVIVLLGAAILTNECHRAFVDPGATAGDNCTLASFSTNGAVDVTSPGVYTLLYIATDTAGNSATNTRAVIVQDTTPPVITQAPSNLTLSLGSNCTAVLPDLTGQIVAADACSDRVTVRQSPAAGAVLPSGTNTIVFSADDGNGNTNNVAILVFVVDTSAPIITMEPLDQTNSIGSTAMFLAGATACSAVIYQWFQGTNQLAGQTNSTLSLSPVSIADAGTYHVIATSAGGSTATRNATLAVPFQAPVIDGMTLTGDGSFQVVFHAAAGQPYTVLGTADLAIPLSGWTAVTSGSLPASGSTNYTDSGASTTTLRCFTIRSP